MKVIDENGFLHFCGNHKEAKAFFGNGTLINEVFEDEVLVATEVYILTLVYENNNKESRQYLADTDWYSIRLTETGVAIPEDVLTKRQEARASITPLGQMKW